MSTIVVTRKGNTASIAADSICSTEGLAIDGGLKINNQKIYAIHGCFVGLVNCPAMEDIFESLINRHSSMLDFSSRQAIFYSLQAVQRLLLDVYHINAKESDGQPVASSRLNGLAISNSGIFSFNGSRNVNEYSQFWAMGSGKDFALGAMQATYESENDPEVIARKGISGACMFDGASSLPAQSACLSLKIQAENTEAEDTSKWLQSISNASNSQKSLD